MKRMLHGSYHQNWLLGATGSCLHGMLVDSRIVKIMSSFPCIRAGVYPISETVAFRVSLVCVQASIR